jgi:hypothetical protein
VAAMKLYLILGAVTVALVVWLFLGISFNAEIPQ